MERRDFIIRALAGVAGGIGAVGLPAADGLARIARPSRPLDRIGVQLYTVRELMAEDFDGTLDAVASIGYREVEFAGYFGRSPTQVRAALDRAGLAAPAAHIGLDQVRSDWDRTLEAASEIGHRYLILPYLPDSERRTLDDYRRFADLFNRAGERAREAGIRFGYHNHAFEFERIDGRVPYDILVEETEPENVAHELDLFWIVRGGEDPLAYIDRYPGRFELVHVKDMDGLPEGRMVAVGAGDIDFGSIFDRAPRAGIRHYFVEHDHPAAPIESIRASFRHLRGVQT